MRRSHGAADPRRPYKTPLNRAAQPEKIEPAAPIQSEAESLDAATPQPELAATVELLQGQIAALRGAEDRYGEPDAVETGEDRRRNWSQSNPLAQRHADKLNDLHRDALQAGLIDASGPYFEYMQNRLTELNAPAAAANRIVADMQQRSEPATSPRQQEAAPDSRYVSAPVSRSSPGLSGARRGRVDLSQAQREAAKVAGISETEYAKQLERFNEMYANGEIQR